MAQEELANLLIKVTSEGFDEAISAIKVLEDAVKGISANSSFGKLSESINKLVGSLAELTKATKEASQATKESATATAETAKNQQKQGAEVQKNAEVMKTLAKVYASFWAMTKTPTSFFNTLNNIAQFNRDLTSMSIVSGMARSSLIALGTAVATFGGSSREIAGFARSADAAMQGFRMGEGGGAWENAAALYGVQISGTGENGLATQAELMRNAVVAMERLQSDNDKRGLQRLLNIPEATYQQMLKGVKAWDEYITRANQLDGKLKGVTKETEDWNRAVAELSQEWEVLKSQVMAALIPYVKKIVELAKRIVEFSQEHHGIIAAIYGLVVAIGTAIAAWTFVSAISGALKLLKVLKAVKATSAATTVATAGGGGAPSSPIPSGGGGGGAPLPGIGKMGALSVGLEAGTAIASAVIAGTVWAMANDLKQVKGILAGWLDLWMGITLAHGRKDASPARKQMYKWGVENLIQAEVLSEESRENLKQMWENADVAMRNWEKRVVRGGRGGGGAARSSTIKVTMNIGRIETSASNYKEFVDDMVKHAKNVVAQRMENADWIDSDNGVIVA